MKINNVYWMNYTVGKLQTATSNLQVGAVLVSATNKCICEAYQSACGKTSWATQILKQAKELNLSSAISLYVTTSTIKKEERFDLTNILNHINIKNIYIGLPDPKLTTILNHDPYIIGNNIHRFPDTIKRKILEKNINVYTNSHQSIKHSPYYSNTRISKLLISGLQSKGIYPSSEDLNTNKNIDDLIALIQNKYNIDYRYACNLIFTELSKAFNDKYSTYSYSDDIRSLDTSWVNMFKSICHNLMNESFTNVNIINIGVGSGKEAEKLFLHCNQITFVDIAPGGLEKIKKKKPKSKFLVASADNLSAVPSHIYDVYVSLRTFNSSYFNIYRAILEAKRVLKSHAVIIISVANGFLNKQLHRTIPGLLIPGTEYIDIYRAFDTAKLIQKELIKEEFQNVQLIYTNTEIYLTAKTP